MRRIALADVAAAQQAARDAGYQEGYSQGVQAGTIASQNSAKHYDQLKSIVRQFELASGICIGREWKQGKEIGLLVRFVREDSPIPKLRRIHDQLTALLSAADNNTKSSGV